MATKQVAAPAFPFPVAITESTANQFATPGSVLVSQSAAGTATLTLTGIASGEALGTLTLSAGAVTLSITGIASTEAVGTPTFSEGALTVSVSGVGFHGGGGAPTLGSGRGGPGAM